MWRENGTWYLLMGAAGQENKATVLLYRSTDLIDWEYAHPLFSGNGSQRGPTWTGTMWECPDFFALDGPHVLIISAHDALQNRMLYPVYFLGRHEDLRFRPERQGILDYGGYFYAPQTLLEDGGRRLVWGWIMEGRTPLAMQEAGWAGVASLPRYLSLDGSRELEITPAPELQTLRGQGWRSVLELFINRHRAASARIYLLRQDSVGLELFATGGNAGVEQLDVWQMDSIW